MKKIRLKKPAKKKTSDEAPTRITNETVAEHRERILAGGRRFKYPHQYVRHRLVINAVIIAVAAMIIVTAVGWWLLYPLQNTSNFMYRVTRVVPVPVASVNGETARYSDYLMRYRSQELWLRTKGQMTLTGEDGKRQLDFIKRQVLDGLIADTYAKQLGHNLNINVSDADVQAVIDSNRNTATGRISQDVFDASTKDTLGYSPDEYRHIIRQALLRQRVSYAIDTVARDAKDKVSQVLKDHPKSKLQSIQSSLKKQGVDVEFGASGLVPKNNQDGGLSEAALKLKNGQVSGVIQSTTGDGYYFVERISANDRQVSYQYLKVPLTVFDKQLAALKKDNKVQEYIAIPDVTSPQDKEG